LENNSSTNTQVENTRNILQLMLSPIFWSGAFLSGTTLIPLTVFLLDKFHDSSLKEVKTQYEISQAKLYSSINAEQEELKRQTWDFGKLKEKYNNVTSSNSVLQEKYHRAQELHYNYCKTQIRLIETSKRAYENMKIAIQFDTPQSPIESALYTIYREAYECKNRFEG